MRRIFPHVTGVVLIFILFGVVFYVPIPKQFESRGVLLTDEVLLFGFSLLFYFLIKQKYWIWKYVALLGTLWIFALPLLRLWETANSTWNIALGLFPWADAERYYLDANNLILGGTLSAFSGKRPLFISLLAILLKLDHQNLQLTLILFVALNGVAAFLFALEVKKWFGPVAAAITIYISQFFYRPYVGTTLTEQLGFPVGLLAFSILFRSIRTSDKLFYALGLGLLTFALFVRAGAFLILPLLFLYGIYFFTQGGDSLPKATGFLAAFMLIPVVMNSLLGRVVSSPNTVQFGNFSYTLYGQAVGGKSWRQVLIDHPEINQLKDPELSREIYRLAFEEIAKNPMGIVLGTAGSFWDFFVPGRGGAFSFLKLGNSQFDWVLQGAATIFFFMGIWFLWKDRKQSINRFFLTFLFGVFLSIPFLPPADAEIRPYAATIGIIFIPIMVSVARLLKEKDPHETTIHALVFETGIGLVLLVMSALGGIFLRYFPEKISFESATCSSESIPINIKVSPGSYVFYVESDSSPKTHIPAILLKDVFRSFTNFPYGGFASTMRKFDEPAFVTLTTDLKTRKEFWLVGPPELVDYEGKIISGCATPVPGEYPVMHIELFEEREP